MNKLSFFIVELTLLLSLLIIPLERIIVKETSSLINYSVVIDPGHGGKDNGCTSSNICEDALNLTISLLLYEELISKGFIAYLTRDGDYDLASENATNRKREDLRNRVSIINSFQPTLLISIHMNSYQNENVYGPMVYYKDEESSKKLANKVQSRLNALTSLNKISHSEDFYLFRNTNCLALLIECGFLSNNKEQEKLNDLSYQCLLVKSISEGIIEYFINNKNND